MCDTERGTALARLLSGIEPLSKPNYHELNQNGHRLLHAVLATYAKHVCDVPDIGWNELGDMLCNAICEEIGDDNFYEWLEHFRD